MGLKLQGEEEEVKEQGEVMGKKSRSPQNELPAYTRLENRVNTFYRLLSMFFSIFDYLPELDLHRL